MTNDATMQEKQQMLRNETALREQGSTFLDHTHNETGGRFSAISNPNVIGSSPNPATQYAAGAPNWVGQDQNQEPPYPVDISALETTGERFEIERSVLGPPSAGCSAQEPSTPDASRYPLGGDVARRGGTSFKSYRRF
jgi:hypothetical protein